LRLKGHATVLLVDDVGRAADYYRAALGFDVETFALNPSHYAYANRCECSLHFARFEGVKPRPNSEAVPPDMFDVYVYPDGDLDALHLELVERGAEVLHGPVEQGCGMREFRVRDPFGYILAFGQPVGRDRNG